LGVGKNGKLISGRTLLAPENMRHTISLIYS